MNILNKALGKPNQAPELLSSSEAFVAIVFLAAASDGDLSNEEENLLYSALSGAELLSNYSLDAIAQLCNKMLSILRQDGFNNLFNLAKESLSVDLRELAFAISTDVVLSASLVTEEEISFLKDLYQALGISRDTAIEILQSKSIKKQI